MQRLAGFLSVAVAWGWRLLPELWEGQEQCVVWCGGCCRLCNKAVPVGGIQYACCCAAPCCGGRRALCLTPALNINGCLPSGELEVSLQAIFLSSLTSTKVVILHTGRTPSRLSSSSSSSSSSAGRQQVLACGQPILVLQAVVSDT
jgi:hypothetical protein